LDLDFIFMLHYFCSCHYNFPSDFSFYLFFIWQWCSHTPELFAFFENVPYINEVSGSNDQNFIVGQINDFCVIIWRLYFFVVLIDIGIESFLNLKVVEQSFIGFISGIGEFKEINETVSFSNFRLSAIKFERKRFRRYFQQMFFINVKQRR
jgi:hypothetical protein